MASAYFTRQSTVPTSEKKFTYSTWFKRGTCSVGDIDAGLIQWYKDTDERFSVFIDANNENPQFRIYAKEAGSLKANITSTQVFRDTSAWYHLVLHIDNSISSNQYKVWINGIEIDSWEDTTWSYSTGANINVLAGDSGTEIELGRRNTGDTWEGCFSDTYYIDGSLIAHTEFGETDSATGIWKPKTEPTIASYGNAGFHLLYDTPGSLGDDSSGNNLDMTVSGTAFQTMDNPSNNFTTLDGSSFYGTGLKVTNGGNSVARDGGFLGATAGSVLFGGKWYFEFKYNQANVQVGVIGYNEAAENMTTFFLGSSGDGHVGKFDYGYAFYINNGNSEYQKSNGTATSWGGLSSIATGSIFQVAFDVENRAMWIGKDGTWLNSATQTEIENGTTTNALFSSMGSSDMWWLPAVGLTNNTTTEKLELNWGNGYFGTTNVSSATSDANGKARFEYTVPSGFYAINTQNLNSFGG